VFIRPNLARGDLAFEVIASAQDVIEVR
jgi:hypothetical protein